MPVSVPAVQRPSLDMGAPRGIGRCVRVGLLTVCCAALFHVVTIRAGHSWGDDFALYLQHAQNISKLRPYSDTGYLYNSQNAIVGPRAYPPGFPTAIAPLVGLFGIDYFVLKVANVLFFLVGLCIVSRLVAQDLDDYESWVCLTVLAFCPVYWEFKDILASENLFFPLWYATLLVADSWYRRNRVFVSPAVHGLVLGVLIFATCATRTVGTVLLPTVIVSEIVIARRLTRIGSVSIATAVGLMIVLRIVLPSSGSGYLEQLRDISTQTLLTNINSDTSALSWIWRNGYSNGLRRIAGLLFALCAVIGFFRANLVRPTALGVATAGYFLLVAIWPSADGLRMVLPLIPAFVLWALLGFDALKSRWPLAKFGATFLLAVSLVSYAAFYSKADFGPLPESVEAAGAQELFDFVRCETRPEDVCIFYKPRVLALYSGHRASAFPLGTDEENFWKYAKSIGARFIVVREGAQEFASEDQTCEMTLPFTERGLREVFRNAQFRVLVCDNSKEPQEIRASGK